MKKLFRLIALLALIMPSLFLTLNFLISSSALHNEKTIQLPLTGYDPVSILHGHYLRIRFDRNKIFEGKWRRLSKLDDPCLCFTQNEQETWKAATVSCSSFAGKSCSHLTKNINILDKSYRYYVDERQANVLEDLLHTAQRAQRAQQRNRSLKRKEKKNKKISLPLIPAPQFSMDVAILEDGAIFFKMLLIDGKPWKQYLQDQKLIKE